MKKIAFVIGGSSGIGLECCKVLRDNNYIVYNGSRRYCNIENINNITLDVVNVDSIKRAVNIIVNNHKRIDVVIYSAGFSMASPIETVDNDDYKYLFHVNLFGLIDTIKEIVPIMKSNGGGRIITISSIGGVIPIPYDSYYSVSKAAVNMLLFNLNNELNRFNIFLTSILPGGVRTNFTFKRKVNDKASDYKDYKHAVNSLASIEQKGLFPINIATKIFGLINKKKPPIFKTIGIINKISYSAEKILSKRVVLGIVRRKFNQK